MNTGYTSTGNLVPEWRKLCCVEILAADVGADKDADEPRCSYTRSSSASASLIVLNGRLANASKALWALATGVGVHIVD